MPTVIDSLIIELGLDPKKFDMGSKAAIAQMEVLKDNAIKDGKQVETISTRTARTIVDSFKKTQDASTSNTKAVSSGGKQAAEWLGVMRGAALELFTAFAVGKGVTDFVRNVTASNVQLGIQSRLTGQSVQDLATWRNAVNLAGGEAGDADASIKSLVDNFNQFRLTGNSATLPFFRALHVEIIKANGDMRSANDILGDTFKALQAAQKAHGSAYASALGTGAGIAPGLVNLMLQNPAEFQRDLDDARKNAPTNADVKASQDAQRGFRGLEQKLTTLGRKWYTSQIQGFQDISRGDFSHIPLVVGARNLARSLVPMETTRFSDLVSRGEGGYNSVNRGAAGGYRSGRENLTYMSVDEVMVAQKAHRFNAAGRYQIIGPTLREAVKSLKLTGHERFNEELQDRIFNQFLIGKRRHQISDYISGKSNDLHAALMAAAKEWASIADPDTGKSHYGKVGHNRASITSKEVADLLKQLRAQHMAVAGGTTTHVTTVHTRIGTVQVHTQAKDANGIAKDMRAAIQKHGNYTAQANYGQA